MTSGAVCSSYTVGTSVGGGSLLGGGIQTFDPDGFDLVVAYG